MKRRALRLLLFLLAGAIINVAVAWVSAWLSEDFHTSDGLYDKLKWDVWGVRGFDPVDADGDISGWRNFGATTLVKEEYFAVTQDWKTQIRSDITWLTTAGWPMRALMGTFESQSSSDKWHFRNAISLNEGGGELLPLLPLWPGFAINTIFYAAVLWVLIARAPHYHAVLRHNFDVPRSVNAA